MTEPEKVNLKTMDIAENKRQQLKALFPEVFAEDKIDFDQLKRVLGEWVEPGKERFGLNWHGKADCMKVIQQSSLATLKPARHESVNFDETENLFIEGDNLEVLKLLQKSYFGKVKMIYIDPPYNTGKEFIYPDKFRETLETYLEYTGQKDENGHKFSTNTETDGRYHSNWLNMMYPRLYLAKNLLRDDGVIFISIDDHEQAHLKALCDQIFGEENFEGHIHWRRRHNQPNDRTKMIGLVAEHILAYAKNKETFKKSGVGKVELTGSFSNSDDDPKGAWASKPWKVGSDQSGSRYEIVTPTGKKYDEEWMGDKNTFNRLLADNRIIFPDKGNGAPRKKYYEIERMEEGQCATNWWPHDIFGHNQEGNKETESVFGVKNIFSNPKPTKLIKQLIGLSNARESDIVMDFFAGSGATAISTIQHNLTNKQNCRFICVQLPESLDSESKEQKTAHEFCVENNLEKNIATLSKERIRRAAKKIQEEQNGQLNLHGGGPLDLGFKVFKLAPSNFKVWESDPQKIENLEQQLFDHVDHIHEASTAEDILYELLLKSGFSLTTPVEKIQLAGKEVFSIEEGALLICLEKALHQEVMDALAAENPLQVICLDEGFQGNDPLKANAVQTFKSRARRAESEILFRTV